MSHDLRLLAGAVFLSAAGDLLALFVPAAGPLTRSGLAVSALFATTLVARPARGRQANTSALDGFRLLPRDRVLRVTIGAALVALAVQGAGMGVQAAWAILPLAFAGYLAGGVGHGVKNVLLRALIAVRVPEAVHGRAYAAYNAARRAPPNSALWAPAACSSARSARAPPSWLPASAQSRQAGHDAIHHVWYVGLVVKTTIYLPDDLHRELKRAAKERRTSEAELIRTAVRHELLGAPAGQAERAQRRARLLAAIGTLDSSVYPSGYLDELRAGWRG